MSNLSLALIGAAGLLHPAADHAYFFASSFFTRAGAAGAAGVAAGAFGPRVGRLLQAATFGLTHVPDAMETGEPVVATVLMTGLAGWIFAVLRERSGSLLAPILAHLAINEAGAIAALAVQRLRVRGGRGG